MLKNIGKAKTSDHSKYCKLLAQGFDGFRETFNVAIPEKVTERLDRSKNAAQEQAGKYGKEPYTIIFGGEVFQIWGNGAGRAQWVLDDDDMRIFIRPAGMSWPVSIEYSAAGLWGFGIHELRQKALKILVSEFNLNLSSNPEDREFRRVSNFHYAFDFESSQFTGDISPRMWDDILCASGVKKQLIGTKRIETITIGTKKSLEVQVYDKGQEITDISGKQWFFDVWGENGFKKPKDGIAKNVWRLEVRFFKDYLRDRNPKIETAHDVFEKLPFLIYEALKDRRLAKRTKDTNRARWPWHEIWSAAYDAIGKPSEILERGGFTNLSGEALNETLENNVIGNLRAMDILRVGDDAREDWGMRVEQLIKKSEKDPDYQTKVARKKEAYAHVHFSENMDKDLDMSIYKGAYDAKGNRLISDKALR